MRILFTRHGESDANIHHIISNRNLPHHLTQKGISQAILLAKTLIDSCQVQMIGVSPIPRAQETAIIVAKKLGLSFTTYPALREFDCGEMEGRYDEEAWAAHHAVIHAWDQDNDFDQYIPPDGESYNDIKERFLPFVASLIKNNLELSGDVLLISHGGILHQVLPIVIKNIDRAYTKQYPLGNCELVVTHYQNGQLGCIEWAGKKLR
jgi:broad specificity phosphatase PhoE